MIKFYWLWKFLIIWERGFQHSVSYYYDYEHMSFSLGWNERRGFYFHRGNE